MHLLDTPGVPRLAVVTAYEHHMRYNFTGYPQVPAGWQQNICSQMTAVSDTFDALRTKRTYSEARDWDSVALLMSGLAGKELHPVLTRNFLIVLDKIREQQPQSVTTTP